MKAPVAVARPLHMPHEGRGLRRLVVSLCNEGRRRHGRGLRLRRRRVLLLQPMLLRLVVGV